VCGGFILTDPVIMSTAREYGPTDLGREGISTFFARHKCNQYCRNKYWMTPVDKEAYFKVQQGTSMMLPTRSSRPPLSQSQLP
jgi:collagenase-like PrtC family protease